MLSQELVRLGDVPQAGEGFTELWEGKYKEKKVAIKVLRLYLLDDHSHNAKKVRLLQISTTKCLTHKILAIL
jgi:hypothetical protein